MKIFIVILMISSRIILAGIQEDVHEFLHAKFGADCEIKYEKILIPKQVKSNIEQTTGQEFFRDEIHSYVVTTSSGEEFTAYLDNVYGKTLPITFLVVFNETGKVDCSTIIKYRETRGYGVKQEAWLEQFKGKDSHSGYTTGNDIQGITGSTISVNSVSRGVRKLAMLYETLKGKNISLK